MNGVVECADRQQPCAEQWPGHAEGRRAAETDCPWRLPRSRCCPCGDIASVAPRGPFPRERYRRARRPNVTMATTDAHLRSLHRVQPTSCTACPATSRVPARRRRWSCRTTRRAPGPARHGCYVAGADRRGDDPSLARARGAARPANQLSARLPPAHQPACAYGRAAGTSSVAHIKLANRGNPHPLYAIIGFIGRSGKGRPQRHRRQTFAGLLIRTFASSALRCATAPYDRQLRI
jgi:hypothetical protein